MARRPATRANTAFELEDWYSSDAAKRSFGRICQAVNEEGEKIGLLGTKDSPYLYLEDIDDADLESDDIIISIEEAKADWSAVTYAAMLTGARFQIQGKKHPRALLYRNDDVPHPALKYRKAQSPHMSSIAAKLEDILKEVQKLGRESAQERRDLNAVASRLEDVAEIIMRRFQEAWRTSNGLSNQDFARRSPADGMQRSALS